MAYQKLQAYSALELHESDTVEIPDPSSFVMTGQATATTTNKLDMAGASFTTRGIVKNAIVYNTTDKTAAFVTAVDSDTVLSLSADIMANGENFDIYNAPTNGCVLYVGSTGDLVVEVAGTAIKNGVDEITFKNVPVGFFPVQVIKLKANTTASNIIGLW